MLADKVVGEHERIAQQRRNPPSHVLGALTHVQEEHPLRNGSPHIVVLARRLGKCIPPEDGQLGKTWSHKIGSKSHEGGNGHPGQFNLHSGDLKTMPPHLFEECDGHVQHFGTDVVRDIKRSFWDTDMSAARPYA